MHATGRPADVTGGLTSASTVCRRSGFRMLGHEAEGLLESLQHQLGRVG